MSAHELTKQYPDIFVGRNIIRICRICESTIGLRQHVIREKGWDISHGLCDRHLAKTLHTAKIPQNEVFLIILKAIHARYEKGSIATRDLEKRATAELMFWLKNPTPFVK